jgi:hypothetical protein
MIPRPSIAAAGGWRQLPGSDIGQACRSRIERQPRLSLGQPGSRTTCRLTSEAGDFIYRFRQITALQNCFSARQAFQRTISGDIFTDWTDRDDFRQAMGHALPPIGIRRQGASLFGFRSPGNIRDRQGRL